MTALTAIKGSLDTLRNVVDVTLMNMPCVTQCVLPSAFKSVEVRRLENVGIVEELPELKNWVKGAVVSCKNDLEQIDVSFVVEIAFSNGCCQEEGIKTLEFTRFVNLIEIRVGNECFFKTKELKLIGLHALERVIIGKNSFTYKGYGAISDGINPTRHFYLKDCEQLKELRIGCQSFIDFFTCEITNVPSLEVIEMGKLNDFSANFWHVPHLELKSDDDEMK